jgi:hypothetical protein
MCLKLLLKMNLNLKKNPLYINKKILEIQGHFYKITLAGSQNQKTTTTASSDELTSKEIFFYFNI